MRTRPYLIILLSLISPTAALAGALDAKFEQLGEHYEKLTPAQKNQILSGGEAVIVTTYDRNRNLPEVFIYKLLKASPEEITAVLTDYERHKNYFSNGVMLESYISKQVSSTCAQVTYKLDIVSGFITETYTVEYNLSQYDNDTSYRVDRQLIRGQKVRAVEGVARIQPQGPHAVVYYYGYIDPGVGLSKEDAVKKIRATVDSLAKQVILEKHTDPMLLQGQIEDLREALGK